MALLTPLVIVFGVFFMALTLLESCKVAEGQTIRNAIVEEYASTGILTSLPFDDIQGGALKYNREDVLPGIGFRGVNEGFSESTGILNPQVETLSITGGYLDVDNFSIATNGPQTRATQELMKAKALGLSWNRAFIKGDSSTDPRVFDGLQARVTGSQLLNAGNTAGGDSLSLAMLDDLIDLVDGPTHLACNKKIKNMLSQAARNASISGYISYDIDQFGQRVTYYNGLPLVIFDYDHEDNQILPFTEANPGGGTPSSTSIYALSIGPGKVIGIQNGPMIVQDMGELESKSTMRTKVEWFSGLAVMHGRAAARLAGVKSGPVVS